MNLTFLQLTYFQLPGFVKHALLVLTLFCIYFQLGLTQPYYLVGGAQYFGYDPGDNLCSSCTHENLGILTPGASGGAGFGPDGNLYILNSDNQSPASHQNNIYQVDLNTDLTTLVMDGPNNLIKMNGLAVAGGGIFY